MEQSPERLIGPQLAKKFPALYVARKYIAAFPVLSQTYISINVYDDMFIYTSRLLVACSLRFFFWLKYRIHLLPLSDVLGHI
jgi:hypothetical protein